MKNLTVALLFGMFITLSDSLIIGKFSLFFTVLFFIFILFVTLFFESYKKIYLFFLLFATPHHLFFNYFHREITPADISLFFTHTSETFESFFALPTLFISSFIILLIGIVLINLIPKIEMYGINIWLKYALFMVLWAVNINSTMATKLLYSLYDFPLKKNASISIKEIPLYPKREANLNILLLIGESMKYDKNIEEKLKTQNFLYQNFFCQKIYSGATNTDVAVPLLLNSKINPLKLNSHNESNLFRLAKNNHFRTSFVSIQSEKSLHHIKPYLQKEFIDYYKSYGKKEREEKFDFLLLEELNKIDFTKQNFIVLQQIGQHSPYRYFSGEKSTSPTANYLKSVEYSFRLYPQIYQKLLATQKPFVFIYTSDHGEFTGEGGRYGHNSFDTTIYEVPLFIVSNITLPSNYKNIQSHHHLSQYLTYLLGYENTPQLSKENHIINGTMLSREDGFITIKEQK